MIRASALATRKALLAGIRPVGHCALWRRTLHHGPVAASPPPGQPVFVSTPIFYVNDKPHLGHLYSAVLADCLSRFHRLQGRKVVFMTGTDEHGIKVEEAAAKAGKAPQEWCDEVSAQFRALFDRAAVSYDDYLRTTEARHQRAVHALWKALVDRGFIEMGKHEGWYCKSDEAFVTDKQLRTVVVDASQPASVRALPAEEKDFERHGIFPISPSQLAQWARGRKEGEEEQPRWVRRVEGESGHPVEWVIEENYKFCLHEFAPRIQEWLERNPNAVFPLNRRTQLMYDIGSLPFEDLSVSRPTARASWALPVPGDPGQSIYVWLDALAVYLTACGYPDNLEGWPATHQIVGKDILRFHGLYWPAFLLAAGLAPPQQIVCHAHWLHEGRKMSKSIGNVVDPNYLIDRLGPDAVRYFLVRMSSIEEDGNFNEAEMTALCYGELADSYGNLLGRTTGKTLLPSRSVPPLGPLTKEDEQYIEKLNKLAELTLSRVNALELHSAARGVMEQLDEANLYFHDNKPWIVRKTDPSRVGTVLHICMESLRICSILLQPITPNMASTVLDYLAVPQERRTIQFCKFGEGTPAGTRLPLPDESIILYRKPEEAKSGKGNKKKRAAAEAAAAAAAAAKNTV